MSRQLKLEDQVGTKFYSGFQGDSVNPMAAAFGVLRGKKCGNCKSVVPILKDGFDKYNKPIKEIKGFQCERRYVGPGKRYNILQEWPACMKFEQKLS